MKQNLVEPPITGPLLSEDLVELARFRVNKEKLNVELVRFKQDCRKKALEVAERTVSQGSAGMISDSILGEADKYYAWLITDDEIHTS